jgi:hypothetical protein
MMPDRELDASGLVCLVLFVIGLAYLVAHWPESVALW